MALIDDIQKMYPDPTSVKGEGYCVGGAIMCYGTDSRFHHAISVRFPSGSMLIEKLKVLNPELSKEHGTAYMFASTIIMLNDTEQYTAAWHKARQALCWTKETS